MSMPATFAMKNHAVRGLRRSKHCLRDHPAVTRKLPVGTMRTGAQSATSSRRKRAAAMAPSTKGNLSTARCRLAIQVNHAHTRATMPLQC